MPLRVLQVITSFTMAGAELMAKRLALGYDPARIQCDIWSIQESASPEGERMFLAGLDAVGVGHSCLGKMPSVKDPRVIARLAAQILRGRYDVVHSHCASPNFYARLASVIAPRTRSMVTLHAPLFPKEIPIERLFSKVTGLYVACSSEILTHMRARCAFASSKVIRILNGIGEPRTSQVTATREDLRRKYEVKPDEHVALVLGRIAPQKAQLDVVEALTHAGSHLGKLKIWIVGEDKAVPEYTRLVRQSIEDKGLNDRVKIWGVVGESEIGQMLKAADLFLLPSELEGMSVAILEALAAGLPTVVSDLENNREVSDAGRVAWLVRPHAPRELASTLDGILADPQAMKARGREAATFVRAKFGFERVISEYSSAYEKLASGGYRPANEPFDSAISKPSV